MSEKPRICITDFITDDLAVEKQILGDLAEVHALGAETERQLEGRVEDAACIMMYHFVSLGAAMIGRLRQCKLIVRCGVGIDNVDAGAARRRGIPVCNVPDYGTEDVADTAMAMMLTLTRGTHLMNSRLRSARGVWNYTQAAPVRRLRGRVFAVIGMGRIGTAVGVRARALGMDVVFYDPYVPDGFINERWSVRPVRGPRWRLSAAQLWRVHLLALLTPVHSLNLLGSLLREQPAWRSFVRLRQRHEGPDVRLRNAFRARVGVRD